MIVYINHYNKKKYSKEVNKINKYYSKAVHSNLEEYIKKTNESINVIYTYTPIFQINKHFEIINNEYIINIYIHLIKAERQSENSIKDFFNSKQKLLIINIEEKNAKDLEFIIMLLEKIEIENNNEK